MYKIFKKIGFFIIFMVFVNSYSFAILNLSQESYEINQYFNLDALDLSGENIVDSKNSDFQPYQEDIYLNVASDIDRDVSLRSVLFNLIDYLDMDEGLVSDFQTQAQGSYMYNAIYWLSLPVKDQVLERIDLQDYGFNQKVRQRIDAWEREGIHVSRSWRDWIEKDVAHEIIAGILIKEMMDTGVAVNMRSVISHLEDNYDISYSDIEDLMLELDIRKWVKEEYSKVLGNHQLTYQKENLSDLDFLNRVFGDKKNFVLSLYREHDGKYGFFVDSTGAVDSNIAAMGMGMAAVSLFYQKGLMSEEEAEDIITKCLNSAEFILENQPKGKDINNLLGKYPFPVIKEAVNRYKTQDIDFKDMDVLDIYDDLIEEEKLEDFQNRIKTYLQDTGNFSVDNIYALKKLAEVTPIIHIDGSHGEKISGIERVERYGWGETYYHFIDSETKQRSKKDVEMSTMDSQLFRMYGTLYPAEVFGGEIAKRAYQIFDAFDYSKDSPFFDGLERGFNHGWRLRPNVSDEGATTNPIGIIDNDYHGDERLILDMSRIIGLHRGEDTQAYQEARDYMYRNRPELVDSFSGLATEWTPTYQGASWTYEYAHSLIDFRNRLDNQGLNWYVNSVKGLLSNRGYALQNGYNPYGAVVGAQEVPIEGYIMDHGTAPAMAPLEKIVSDGTFSPSQVGIDSLPFESLESLWIQYQSNPRLAQGRYGFRDSYNAEKNFWAPGNYLLNEVQLLFKIENAIYGTVWDTFESNAYVAEVMADTFESLPGAEEINILRNLSFKNIDEIIQMQDYEIGYDKAKSWVKTIVNDVITPMVRNQDESRLEYFRDYIKYNDVVYNNALKILNSISSSVETEALKYVIYKNQKRQDKLLNAANSLIEEIKKNPEKFDTAVNIISSYDYEATVMWRGYAERSFIPVLSRSDIENNLRRAVDLNSPEKLLHAPIANMLETSNKLFALFPEHSGAISALVEGFDLEDGGRVKGLRELIEDLGWREATNVFAQELHTQAKLIPHLKNLLGRDLELINPDGKDAGFLASWSNQVEGGLKDGQYVFDETQDWRKNPNDIRWQIAFERRMIEHAWFKLDRQFDPVKGDKKDIKTWHDVASIAKSRSNLFGRLLYVEFGDWRLLKGEHSMAGSYFGVFNHDAPVFFNSYNIKGNGGMVVKDNQLRMNYGLSEDSPVSAFTLNLFHNNWVTYDNIKFNLETQGNIPDSFRFIIRNRQGEEVAFRVKDLDDFREIIFPRYGSSVAYRVTGGWKNHLRNHNIEFIGDVYRDWITDWENISSITIEVEAKNSQEYGEGAITLGFRNVWYAPRL